MDSPWKLSAVMNHSMRALLWGQTVVGNREYNSLSTGSRYKKNKVGKT